jgi:hypothetical protein
MSVLVEIAGAVPVFTVLLQLAISITKLLGCIVLDEARDFAPGFTGGEDFREGDSAHRGTGGQWEDDAEAQKGDLGEVHGCW